MRHERLSAGERQRRMSSKIQLLERGGPLAPVSERWQLIVRDDGTRWIEHERWVLQDRGDPELASTTTGVEQFIATNTDVELKDRLMWALRATLRS